MKVKPEHFAQLVALLRVGVTRIPAPALYDVRDPSVKAAHLIVDPARRYRWDALWAADGAPVREWTSAVYEYANDTHIDTALKAALVEVSK